MAGAALAYECGPITYHVGNSAGGSGTTGLVRGGDLVVPDTSTGAAGDVMTCGTANALNVLGVTMTDGANEALAQGGTTIGEPFTLLLSPLQPYVAVASEGVFRLKASSAVALGQLCVADNVGGVKAYTGGGTSTFDMIVAKLVDPAGACASGAIGLFMLLLS
jgi:hypothetical protein